MTPEDLRPKPYVGEDELPSDAAMLRWIHKHNAGLAPAKPDSNDCWVVTTPYTDAEGVVGMKLEAVGRTPYMALENAMKGNP